MKTHQRNITIALLIFIAGLIITILTTNYSKNLLENQREREFEVFCNEISFDIKKRIDFHAQLLQNISSFISSSDTVTKKEWESYISHSKIKNILPGYQGIGYNILIPKNQLDEHIDHFSKVYKDYKVKPANDREVYSSIIYLEPQDELNQKAIGYDTYQEPVRREAMQRACDLNQPILTHKLILVQESDKNPQSGVIMFAPVYKRDMPLNNIKERQDALIGWVSSPYRMNDLMENIIGHWNVLENKKVSLHIYDGDDLLDEHKLFDSEQEKPVHDNSKKINNLTQKLDLHGRHWSLVYAHSDINTSFLTNKVTIIFSSGLIISLLLSLLLLALLNTQYNAKLIAIELTNDLQQKNAELELAKIKAEESDRLKSQFLMNMSHEIRTPMNGVLGFLDLLKNPDLNRDTSNNYIDIISKSGERLLETINDIIEISRIESGEVEVHYQKVNLNETIKYVYNFFHTETKAKGLDFKIAQLLDESKAIIKTDKIKLEGILTNLIKNAIKFTDEGYISISNFIKNKDLVFIIQDSGSGIPSESIESIFNNFVQANKNKRNNHEGSGLGLSIVKAYIAALDGHIQVESTENKGTTFTFSIPYMPDDNL
ncbi:sensor histidine kinase [Plebeiibacterium sediminum]|uniref:histidine kinase n=1 Tax=Plebeiibacterium sediminum TaxID=2992112 RepID=A0AAE3SFU0_9BACT|nr:CHASE domain-containing protein [Plebeiobacterium sediminum]MCW3787442.1 CHASE domain-containing protein [Plebeiobacterium sediminum]